MLGLLLFDFDLIDFFLESEDDNITSYADDTTPYSCAQDIPSVISELQRITKKFLIGVKIIIRMLILENVMLS